MNRNGRKIGDALAQEEQTPIPRPPSPRSPEIGVNISLQAFATARHQSAHVLDGLLTHTCSPRKRSMAAARSAASQLWSISYLIVQQPLGLRGRVSTRLSILVFATSWLAFAPTVNAQNQSSLLGLRRQRLAHPARQPVSPTINSTPPQRPRISNLRYIQELLSSRFDIATQLFVPCSGCELKPF